MFNSFVTAQNDYKNYNLNCYAARKLAFHNQLDSAIIMYKQAFDIVDFIHIENLLNAYDVALKVGDDSLSNFTSRLIADRMKKKGLNKYD